MQEIKWRFRAISDVRNKIMSTTYEQTNIEFCLLQVRKTLELIALSSLVSDTDIYKEKLGNIERMWKADLIFKDIGRIHPNFYPVPINFDPNNKHNWIDYTSPFLTKELFIKAYSKCGKFLHATSPYLSEKERNDIYIALWDDIDLWYELIIGLLSNHNINLYNQKALFHIQMGASDALPTGYIFHLVEE